MSDRAAKLAALRRRQTIAVIAGHLTNAARAATELLPDRARLTARTVCDAVTLRVVAELNDVATELQLLEHAARAEERAEPAN